MKVVLLMAAALVSGTLAYPGKGKTLVEIQARAAPDAGDSFELIGDLATLQDNQLTPVGRSIKNIITKSGKDDPQSSDSYFLGIVPPKGSQACARDKCCIWQYISGDMAKAFRGQSGRCNNLARAAVRLGFHDAAGWSKATGPLGGADGSIVLAPEEMARPENRGLEDIVAQMKAWASTYQGYGVSMADLIQMGATTATVVCPLGPRVRSFVGRRDSSAPCTDGLLPPVTQSADFLIDLFANKTIRPHGLTALIGAHTSSQQQFVDPSRAGDPQDSSPGVWDVLFYKQMLGLVPTPARVFRFASDVKLAADPRIKDEFAEFAGNGGQQHWNEDFSREYVRLSLLGVSNISSLTECTKVLPGKQDSYNAPDQSLLNEWLSTLGNNQQVAKAVLNGDLLNAVGGLISGLLSGLGRLFGGH